jgi:uncharacterized protein (DUF885 family)
VNQTLADAPTGPGVWALPSGAAYYAHLLRHHTTTDLTATDIHTYGLEEVARIRAEIQARLDTLGYPRGETLAQSFVRVARDGGGQVAASDCIARYNAIARDAETRVASAVDITPRTAVEVRADPVGGYYIAGAPDGSRPGVFYAYVPPTGLPAYSMRTLTYHETAPGHHTQIAIARELPGLPLFRTAVNCTGHAEGWALCSPPATCRCPCSVSSCAPPTRSPETPQDRPLPVCWAVRPHRHAGLASRQSQAAFAPTPA